MLLIAGVVGVPTIVIVVVVARSHLRAALSRGPPRIAAKRSAYGAPTGREGRSGGRRPRRRDAKRRRKEWKREDARARAREARARREETEIEKGRGRWRLQGYTRPEQGPSARASERASTRRGEEARLRFPRCLLAARPRLSLACYSTLCSYAIRATLRLRKA